MLRGPTSLYENTEGRRHRLVGKVLIQGEENITSAMLSQDGKILAVATISSIKVFSVRRRKGDEKGTLRIQKLDVPSALSEDGARIVTISPDSRWLCFVRPNSDIYLARIEGASSPQEKPHLLTQLTKVNRAQRHSRHEKPSHGTLGNYERTIRCAVFSTDSRVLASGDLSGCVDTWVLEKVAGVEAPVKTNSVTDDELSDDDDEEENPVIEGERWCLAGPETPIPRLKSGVVLLSFRPQGKSDTKLLANGTDGTTSGLPTGEDHLMVLTSEHQLVEFEAYSGKLSDWSRRNPKACLPAEFRGVKDRAMGCVWDLSGGRERLWLYGTSWMWMFDLNQDFPSPEEVEASASNQERRGQLIKASSQKRKRDDVLEEEEHERKKPNSGAGDKIPLSQTDVSLGSRIRKVIGNDDSQGEWISLEKENRKGDADEDEEVYEYDEVFATTNEKVLARFRRDYNANGIEESNATPRKALPDASVFHADTSSQQQQQQLVDLAASVSSSQPARRWWHTYKYRDILGIVPLSTVSADGDAAADMDAASTANDSQLEVAVVERPMWDVELPGRYVRDYE